MTRRISLFLAFILLFSSISPIKLKAEPKNTNIDITDYIKRAREIFGISKDYDKVTSNIGEEKISIKWSFTKDNDKREGITFDYSKNVIDYYKTYKYKRFNRTLVSEDKAREKADNLVKELYPGQDLRFENIETSELDYILNYRLYFAEVRAFDSLATIFINKETGIVSNTNTTEAFRLLLMKSPKVDIKGIKSKEVALNEIKNKFQARLDLLDEGKEKYVPYYTWDKNLVVDAKTLKPVESVYFDADGFGSDGDANKKEGALTEKEIKVKDKIKNLKTKKEAIKKAIKLFKLPKDKLERTSLNDFNDGKLYSYNLTFRSEKPGAPYFHSNVTLKADDLMPLNFWYYENKEEKKVDLKKVQKYIKKFSKELSFFKEYKKESSSYGNKEKRNYSVKYLRRIGKYTLPHDSISFEFNGKGLSSYNLSRIWDKIDYYEEKVDANKAFENLIKKYVPNLYILPVLERQSIKKIELVYAVEARINRLKVRGTDGLVGLFDNSKILTQPTGEIKDELVRDAINSGFGVVENKNFTDKITYRDLLFNLSLFDEYVSRDVDENLNKFKDLGIFDKSKLETPVKLEVVAKALVLSKLKLKPEDIKTNVFSNDIKADERTYPALLIMLSGSHKEKDFTKEATAQDLLELIASVIF